MMRPPLPIRPARTEPRGPFPWHTSVEYLPAEVRQVLTALEARRRARRRRNEWRRAHGLDPLEEI